MPVDFMAFGVLKAGSKNSRIVNEKKFHTSTTGKTKAASGTTSRYQDNTRQQQSEIREILRERASDLLKVLGPSGADLVPPPARKPLHRSCNVNPSASLRAAGSAWSHTVLPDKIQNLPQYSLTVGSRTVLVVEPFHPKKKHPELITSLTSNPPISFTFNAAPRARQIHFRFHLKTTRHRNARASSSAELASATAGRGSPEKLRGSHPESF